MKDIAREDIRPAFAERNIPVVFTPDENYLPYVKAVVDSAITNAVECNLDFLILHPGIRDELIQAFTARYAGLANVSVRFVDLSGEAVMALLADIDSQGIWPLSAFYRLLLPDILRAYDKLVYLDVDLAVCGDLGRLYSVDLGDCYFAAARDVVHSTKPEYLEWAAKWGFTAWAGYVNAGVLVMNLARFRREPVRDRLLDVALEATKWFCDQDALNFVCKGRIAPLDPRWNVQLGEYCIKEQIALTGEEMWIAHFTGVQKPWKFPVRRYSHRWWQYVDADDFPALWSAAWGDVPVAPRVETPKISIVMPVYNAARYLPEALASVLLQKELPEIEVICIDDGSTDDSAAILAFWEAHDPRLTVIRQKNQGPGVARNAGLEAAKGEYIYFLDADDRLSSGTMLRQAYEQAGTDDLDILLADGVFMSENGKVGRPTGQLRRNLLPAAQVFAPDALGVNVFMVAHMGPSAKLLRRKFLDDNRLRFPALKRSEDFPMIRLAMALARRLGVMPQAVFHRRTGVATSLESTKDETPLIFADAERIFQDSLSERGLLDRFRRAADAAYFVNLAYNLRKIGRFSNFRAVARLCAEKLPELKVEDELRGVAQLDWALKTVAAVDAAVDDNDALADLFADFREAWCRSSAVQDNAQLKAEKVALLGRLKALAQDKAELSRRVQASAKENAELRRQNMAAVKSKGDPWNRMQGKEAERPAARETGMAHGEGRRDAAAGTNAREENRRDGFPKISFVVPVYNTESFLAATLDSILAQTYKNIEVICSNDCATDASPQICEAYAKKDPRVKVVSAAKNGGVSRARNLGMEQATGDYIWFFDSDDLLHPQAAEIMLNACEKNDADFAYTPVERVPEDATLAGCVRPVACTVECVASPTDPYRLYGNFYGVQHILAKAALVRKIRFEPDIAYGEDVLFAYRFLVDNPKCVYVHSPLVYYRQRGSSAVHTLGKERIKKNYDRVIECLKPLLMREMAPEIRTVLTHWLETHGASNLPRPESESDCYAVMASDAIRAKSTSGGVFTVLAEEIIARDGCVAGAVYADDWSVKHALTETVEGLAAMRGSKYVRGVLDRTFLTELDAAVESGRPVLFTGLPCQVAAMRKRYGERSNLVLLDIICHGAPDARLWQKRVQELSAGGKKITGVNFRDKRAGWGGGSSTFAVRYDDGSESAVNLYKDPYGVAFGLDLLLPDGCTRCPFACEKRVGDITIGDFWDLVNHSFNDRKGLSCVVVNTLKGRELFACVRDRFSMALPQPVATVGQPNFHRPSRPHPFSREFQKDVLDGMPFDAAVAKYAEHPRSVALLNFHWEQTNFGALLTSFALSRHLADLGWKPQNIDYSPREADSVSMRANDGFESFRYRHLPRTPKITDGRTLGMHTKRFGTFVVGSDQVWAKRITAGKEDAFFLSFAGPGKRLVSAAASFGRVPAAEWDPEELKARLGVFSAISIREREDAQTVKALVGKGACVPDPVFWVERSVWDGLADEAKNRIDGAIAVYCVNKDETAGLLNFLARSGMTTPEKPARVLSCSLTPEEWLYAIRSAKLLVTDSFHGTCFSILFHTPFVCIHANEARSVRHGTLLDDLGLSNRLFRDGESASLSYRSGMDVDWAEVDDRISQYREQGRSFIAAALATDDMASPEMAAAWSRLEAYRKEHPWQSGGSAVRRETAAQILARLNREPPQQPETPGVSVIIPAYNAEKYIDDCLASLFAEGAPSGIEIICIDDGSTDGTLERLRCWEKAAHNIRIVEQKNQGPGAARNAGMRMAKGEYICFLDADDRLSRNASLAEFSKRAAADDLDMLVCGSNQMFEDGTVLRKAYLNESLVPVNRVFGPESLGNDLYQLTPQSPWSKLYRRKFLTESELSFPSLRRAEDFAFVQLAYTLAKRIGVEKAPLIDHRIGVETSCEATKDDTPLLFFEGEKFFRDSMRRRRILDKFKTAADISFVRRLSYNLGAVQRFDSFLLIAKKASTTYKSMKEDIAAAMPSYMANSVETLDKAVDNENDPGRLAELFVELRIKDADKAEIAKRDALQKALDATRLVRDAALKERDSLKKTLNTTRTVRDTALNERNSLKKALNATRTIRDAALRERDSLKKTLDTTRTVRDTALNERNSLKKALDATRTVRDAALRERDSLKKTLDTTRTVRDAALRERDSLKKTLDTARTVRDAALRERDSLKKTLEATRGVRDAALKERDSLKKTLEATRGVRDVALKERDMLKNTLAEVRKVRDATIRERNSLRSRVDSAIAKYDVTRTELSVVKSLYEKIVAVCAENQKEADDHD